MGGIGAAGRLAPETLLRARSVELGSYGVDAVPSSLFAVRHDYRQVIDLQYLLHRYFMCPQHEPRLRPCPERARERVH